jgi:hypothetical protein
MKPCFSLSVFVFSLALIVLLKVTDTTAQSSYLDRIVVRTRTVSGGGNDEPVQTEVCLGCNIPTKPVRKYGKWNYLQRRRSSKDKNGFV